MEYGEAQQHVTLNGRIYRRKYRIDDFRADSTVNRLLILLDPYPDTLHQLDIETSLFSIV